MQNIKTSAATAIIALISSSALGQSDYPTKPVRVIVASSPGGGTDLQARMFAQKLSESLKQQFTVDNRPGAGDTIGTGLTAKSPPDGYTLLVVSPSFTMAPALYPKFPVDPTRDLTPISMVASSPLILLVHPSVPAKNTKELIALAKAKPEMLNVGVGPLGTFTHLVSSSFATAANIKVTSIPYPAVGRRYSDALSGETHMIFMPGSVAIPHMKSGRLRALGVSSAKRSALLPDLPTLAEGGAKGYDVTTWYGWVAPAGTPAPIINKLNMELVRAVKSPDMNKRLLEDGADPVGNTPEQFGQIIAHEVPHWRKATQDAGVKVE